MSLSTQYQEVFEKLTCKHHPFMLCTECEKIITARFLPKSFIQEEIEKLKIDDENDLCDAEEKQLRIDICGSPAAVGHELLMEKVGYNRALSSLSSSLGLTK